MVRAIRTCDDKFQRFEVRLVGVQDADVRLVKQYHKEEALTCRSYHVEAIKVVPYNFVLVSPETLEDFVFGKSCYNMTAAVLASKIVQYKARPIEGMSQ